MGAAQNEFSGGIFDPAVAAGRVSGTIRIENGSLSFQSDSGHDLQMPLEGLEISEGGASHRMIFLKHPDHPDNSIFTTELSILKCPELAGTSNSASQVGKAMKRVRNRRTLLLVCLLVFVGLGFGAWAIKNVLVASIVRNLPAEWESALGRAAIQSSESTFVHDPAADQALQEMLRPLLQHPDLKDRFFKFHIAKDEAINAFAAPGGYVVINTGLIAAAERPEQVLGVVAHEIAHVTKRHGVRAIVENLGIRVLLGIATGGTDMPVEWIGAGSQLLQLRHSRHQESEADEVGWGYLTGAGIDPRGLQEFFAIIKSEHSHLSIELLSTHPAPQSRIDDLNDRWDQRPASQKLAPVDPRLLDRLKEQLNLPHKNPR